MEVVRIVALFAWISSLASCAATALVPTKLDAVYVADFHSDEMERCRPSDVPLGHGEARAFFMRSRQVDRKVLHDHYNHAPCYIEGTLKYGSTACEWEIRAGATGHIQCGKDTWYFACDSCADLFQPR